VVAGAAPLTCSGEPGSPPPVAERAPSAASPSTTAPANAGILAALDRSLAWLETHPPDASSEPLGARVLDAMGWFVFAVHHPDAGTRERTGAALDRRLDDLPWPAEPTMVEVTYLASVMTMRRVRGLSVEEAAESLRHIDYASLLEPLKPTTRYWTLEQLRRVGLDVEPDFASTFVGSGGRDFDVEPVDFRDAYRVYHDLAPAVDFGREPPRKLRQEHRVFVQRMLPEMIAATIRAEDTDAAAEALIAAALAGARSEPSYREGLTWLLSRQRDDGTFSSNRDRPDATAGHFRHVVFVGSWALLGAADCGIGAPDFCPD